MLKTINTTFLLFVLFLVSGLFTSKLYANVNNLSLSQLSVDDGLSQGTVNSLLQDSTGFMWLATESGLNFYDGYSFRTLKGPQGDFDSFEIRILLEDSDGLLWINVLDQGIYTYNPKTTQYQLIVAQALLNKNEYISHVLEHDNTFWISSSKKIFTFKKSDSTAVEVLDLSLELINDNWIHHIVMNNDYLFLATDVGLFVYHTIQNKWKKLPDISSKGQSVAAVRESKVYKLHTYQNNLYIGTYISALVLDISEIDAFFLQDKKLPKYKKLAEGIAIWQFYQDGEKLYIASHQGLSVILLKENRLEHLFGFTDAFDNASDNIIRSITKDRNGVFWLGTNSSGVYLWDPSTELVTNFTYNQKSFGSLSYNEVWKILPHHKNKDLFWVATGNGLNLVNGVNQKVKSYLAVQNRKELYGESHIFQMAYYNNYLILGTYKGITVFDTITRKIVPNAFSPEIDKLFHSEVINFFVDENNLLWLVNSQGIFKVMLDEFKVEKFFDAALDKNYKSVKQDVNNILGFLPNSSMLLFSNNDSLWGIDITTKQSQRLYQHPRTNISEWSYIDNWVIDKSQTLWLSFVGKGLIGLSLPDFKPTYYYSSSNSPIDNNIYNLKIDNEGDIWFSSHDGLFMMNRESHHFRNFGVKDGLVNKEFNGGAGGVVNGNKFAYGGMAGLSLFDPIIFKKQQSQNTSSFKLKVTHVNVLSRELNLPITFEPDQKILLNYNDVGIRVDFSAFTFGRNNEVKYQFKLMGHDNVEYPLTSENSITFPTLASGNHTLEARIKSPLTGKYSEPARIVFSISYSPWASPFAYFIYLFVTLSIITIWIYKRQLQRKALLSIHEEVKYRENRLQLALIGSNSEVWDWQAHNNLIFAKRATEDLGLKKYGDSYSFEKHVELIHPDDQENFIGRWRLFLNQKNTEGNFNCTYRLKSKSGQWLWYKDLGKIVEFYPNGSPSRVTGSYTNITENKAAEERALYYGDAFKQTKDWVFIISENFTRVTANQSLCDVFGWEKNEFDFNNELFGFNKDQRKKYREVFSSLNEGEHWRGEERIFINSQVEYHVILNITVSRNTTNNQLHYICVFTDITAQKTAEKELRYLANYDHLTNLPNRSFLLERIQDAMNYSHKKKSSIALFFIDLDRFKQVNDSLGHDNGDLLLKEITVRLNSILRARDTVARIGGDEFVVLLEYFKGTAQLSQIAQKMITTIGEPVNLNSNIVSVGASIGIALYPDDAKNSDELLHHADIAMYYSKQLGRNTYQFFTERMNQEATERLQVESNLKQAIYNQEFVNYYQPIVNPLLNQTIGLELLLRWQSKGGLISPLVFIPKAEELGLIITITEQVVNIGLQRLVEWRKHNQELFLSINISPFHFVNDNLYPFIKAQLKKYDLPPSAIKLEVTESALIAEPKKAISTMNALSDLGILMALDDFGTGYSSLSYLKQLPLHVIKIDRSFVSGIGVDDTDEAIVDATIVLAKRLNMKCIAEGVETQEQLDYLLARQCHNIQGYLYSRPMDAAGTTQYLSKDSDEK
ncbi:EAL domain-containing protein [Pseudocolwellia agarivorans]|uniref:EAL domain-containing protein n=1 Tax=Pseudocolwellia agarivorans TaxID=1911682 RepID=UPI0009855BE0|nr:EAL domain-containing protein [Pseudocolwellia agarivorans]